ncbi:MAG: branched-chain amino acid ABC transporter permease [Mycobacteriales bacterium]
MLRFVNATLNGVSQGMIFAAVALALVLIFRATRVINFAAAAMAMFTTFIAAKVISGIGHYWIGFVVALLIGLVLGALIERLLIRPVNKGPEINAVIVTLGLFIFLEALAPILFGNSFKSFPPAFSVKGIKFGSTTVQFSQFDFFIIGSVLLVTVALFVLFQLTPVGLRMRASAFSPEVARLLGVKVGSMLTLGWALAALGGSLAGMLVAPTSLLFPQFMDAALVFGFVAAIIGGLESPLGAVIGGLLMGLWQSYISSYVGSSVVTLAALVILIAVLMIRPNGIFSTTSARRV